MAQEQHTRGPWRADQFTNQTFVISGSSTVVCEIGYRGDQVNTAANARLIAAAPDMLAAIKRLMPNNLGSLPATMPDSATLPLDVTFGELRQAMAAIAKAEGLSTRPDGPVLREGVA